MLHHMLEICAASVFNTLHQREQRSTFSKFQVTVGLHEQVSLFLMKAMKLEQAVSVPLRKYSITSIKPQGFHKDYKEFKTMNLRLQKVDIGNTAKCHALGVYHHAR